MKRLLSTILCLCIIVLSISNAFAMTTRANRDADMSFSSGRVVCQCSVSQPGSEIDLTMKLYRNGRVVKTWSDTSMNYVFLLDSYPAISGSTYQLTFTCYVDGAQVSIPSITKVCP